LNSRSELAAMRSRNSGFALRTRRAWSEVAMLAGDDEAVNM
jgi:hypothetical protein